MLVSIVRTRHLVQYETHIPVWVADDIDYAGVRSRARKAFYEFDKAPAPFEHQCVYAYAANTENYSLYRRLQDIDNPFFRHTTAGWPLARLVDLVTDAYLVESPPLSVIYEEGETTPWVTGNVIRHPATDVSGVDCTGLGTSHTIRVGGASGGGRHGTGNRAGTDGAGVTVGKTRYEKKWTTGAYVILRGSVNLYIFER